MVCFIRANHRIPNIMKTLTINHYAAALRGAWNAGKYSRVDSIIFKMLKHFSMEEIKQLPNDLYQLVISWPGSFWS